MIFLDPVQRRSCRHTKRLAARLALASVFFLAVAHNIAFANISPIGARLIWAKFFLGVHLHFCKLICFVTNKFADELLFLPVHVILGFYPRF